MGKTIPAFWKWGEGIVGVSIGFPQRIGPVEALSKIIIREKEAMPFWA